MVELRSYRKFDKRRSSGGCPVGTFHTNTVTVRECLLRPSIEASLASDAKYLNLAIRMKLLKAIAAASAAANRFSSTYPAPNIGARASLNDSIFGKHQSDSSLVF